MLKCNSQVPFVTNGRANFEGGESYSSIEKPYVHLAK